MIDQLPTFGDLASIFQLAAGVALAMSVFRAPYEQRYQRLGAILDREELILRGRDDQGAVNHMDNVVAARVDWLAKGRELEPIIRGHETWIWVSVVVSCGALVVCSLWPAIVITRFLASLSLLIVIGPMIFGAGRIVWGVRDSLAVLTNRIENL
jgi:hypothetical protein